MAISKAEVAQRQSEEFARSVSAAEAHIDKVLCDLAGTRKTISMGHLRPEVRAELEKRYRAVGWTVTIDGNVMVFE